jgi:hypothetical protein
MEQYTKETTNFVVGNISLGEGREESTMKPMGDCDAQEKTPVMSSDDTTTGMYEEE